MKKLTTLLLALLMVLSTGFSAIAAEDIVPQNAAGTALNGGNVDLENRVGGDSDYDADIGMAAYGFVDIAPRIAWVNDNTIAIAKGELFLVDTTTHLVLLPETILAPGSEYEFQVFYATADFPAWDIADPLTPTSGGTLSALTEGNVNGTGNVNGRLRLRSGKGNSVIQKSELKLKGSGANRYYYVAIETKDTYTTKMTDVTYTLVPSGTLAVEVANAGLSILQSGISLQVGHLKMLDQDIDDYSEGDVVTIYNDRPIMTKKQIDRLVKAYNYKAIELEFEDGSWRYEGRMSGMSDTNFYTTQEVIPAIMNKFDQDFKFLILPAGATFPTNGEMRIDVSDVSEDWDRIYTYLYRNGKLTPINTSYDSVDDMIYFRTNYLGAFVMTDVEITDTSIIENSQPEPSAPESSTGTSTGGHNPPTGMPIGMNLVAGLGVISLLSAGTVIIRKKK